MRMSVAAPLNASALRVVLLTDVEGNWQYVRNVVRQSSCLKLTEEGEGETLELEDDCMLVFGGDAGDKGGQTLQCYEQLVKLKKKHPDRVVLLVGNRDVNKMRFTSELHDSSMNLHTMAKEILEGPTWVPKDKRVTLKDFLATQQQSNDGEIAMETVNTKVNRLKWMLEHTMGAQGDFSRRRDELRSRKAEFSDKDVLNSYMDSVEDGDVIMCDTSYSDSRAADNRGNAASEVVVEPSGRVLVNGVLEDGRRVSYTVQDDPWIGRRLRDGTMVKAHLVNEEGNEEDASYLVLSVENGFQYSYHDRTVAQLLEIGLLD
ncbi:hypothetical protein BBP00_00002701 [Phytophthora kernoviae]|uniref:Uncharacterized protein n=1 Tax=Phytophthora kernoviae TaxID=325452 RepID=A0A3F2RWP3_9STRA|nr:hypothetical protein BBP00_00002701 [Phytophthora kernoviae]